MRSPAPLLLFAAAAILALPACRPDADPAEQGPERNGRRENTAAGESSGPGEAPTAPHLVDVEAQWRARFTEVLPGSYDGQPPELAKERERHLLEQLSTATSKSRSLRKYASRAREELAGAGDESAAALAAWVADEACVPEDAELAFTFFHENPPPALVSLCLRWMDDRRAWLRRASYVLLGRTGSAHVLPRMLRRLKYEEDPELFPYLCQGIARLGNPSPVSHLLQRLDVEALRATAARELIWILALLGEDPYVESDGWGGLRAKSEALLARFHENGELLKPLRPPLGAPEGTETPTPARDAMEPLAQREFWLFMKALGGDPLRPVDDARFVGRRLGAQAVPLVKEAQLDDDKYVRVHALEIARDLGRTAGACGDHVFSLLSDRFCRNYALETLGAIGDDRAMKTYEPLLRPGNKARRPEHIAALKGLAQLGDPRGVPIARRLLSDESQQLEIRVYAAHAVDFCARGAQRSARSFLSDQLEKGAYHAPTLRELLAK